MIYKLNEGDIVIYAVAGQPRIGKIVRAERQKYTVVSEKGWTSIQRKASELISFDKFSDAIKKTKGN